MILEAKIELSEEKMTTVNKIIKEKKIEKDELFMKRDSLIDEKRILQKEMYEEVYADKDGISENINKLSEEIGHIIENSKALSEEIQEKYDESQVEYEKLKTWREQLKIVQRESNNEMLSFKRKIAEIDNDLTKLRVKMSEIQEKLTTDR